MKPRRQHARHPSKAAICKLREPGQCEATMYIRGHSDVRRAKNAHVLEGSCCFLSVADVKLLTRLHLHSLIDSFIDILIH